MQDWARNNVVSLIAVAVVALVVIWSFTRQSPPPIEVRPRDPQPSPIAVIYVHVDGAVHAPGVYSLPAGSRLFEAVERAGGATDDANVSELNLAARVTDGTKLIIPAHAPLRAAAEEMVVQPSASAATPVSTRSAPSVQTGPPSEAKINLNTATQRILETLPGIGPVTATRIINHRQANGPFTRIEQLREANLVNARTYELVRSLVAAD